MDSFPSLGFIFKSAFKDVGVVVKDEDIPYLSRVTLSEGYHKFARDEDKVAEYISLIKKYLYAEEALKMTKIYEDTLPFFDWVKKNNLTLGIVTSNEVRHVLDVMEFLGLDSSIFKVIVGSDILRITKPNPEPIYYALEKLGYKGDKNDVIYIGDGLNDYKSALNAGVAPLMIDREDHYDDSFNKIKTLKDLYD